MSISKTKIWSSRLKKTHKGWVEISKRIHMGTIMNGLYLLRCPLFPDMKDLVINTIPSISLQRHNLVLYVAVHSLLIPKK